MAETPPTQQQQSAPRGDRRGETVTVACKLPHGLVLRAFNMVEKAEPVMGGGSRDVKKAEQLPGEFVIAGNSFPENGAPRARMEFGFALTPGCPKELWDRWHADNKDSPMVKNGLVFAYEKAGDTVAEARDNESVRSGFERLDPAKLPRGIQKAERVAA